MAHLRWTFADQRDSWTFPINPKQMTSPFPRRNIAGSSTTAGKPIVYEAPVAPYEWSFSGTILTADHYEKLREWVAKPGLITITDHYGRKIHAYMVKLDAQPKRSVGRYWAHEYTVETLVVGPPSAPTVGEVPR